MRCSKLSESDLFGLFYLSVSKTASYADYYASLDRVAPLVRSSAWESACTGYYLSGIDRLVRVSYFASDPALPVAAQAEVFSGKGLLAPRPAETPHPAEVAAGYGGHELEFRRYLCIYTQIGLDLFEAGRLHAQRLVATYRRQVWLVAGAARQHFEPSFLRMSESYRLLPEEEQEVFWRNFDFSWGWSHMFVNMILAIDWHLSPDPAAIPPSNDEVSALLLKEGLDFDVPSDWEPHASG